MEQTGPSNGHDVKPQKSPPAAGANKSPKKRRKVNHGTLWYQRSLYSCFGTLTDFERVPAACVYCRRSVSPQLGPNTWGIK